MCISPVRIENGSLVGCRNCWQCRTNRVQSWVGRNIAETETATVSYAVTLTYGRDWDGRSDHIQSVQLMYSDIQKLLKRMRKAGYIVRYIAAGEYGAALGRAHWHCIFHFYGDTLPEWEGIHLKWNQKQWDTVGGIHIPEWSIYGEPLGHVHIKKATYAHTQYALKYLMKDQIDPEKHTMLHMSKNPPLGYAYFMRLADETAQAGTVLEDLKYKFNVRTASGEEKQMSFLLTGKLAEMYLTRYLETWKALNGKRWWPSSELIDNFAQWGKLGNEDRLTEKRASEEIPKMFTFQKGEYKLRKVGEATDVERKLYPNHFDKRRPETLAEYSTRRAAEYRIERAKERNERKQNDPAWKRQQRQRIERQRNEAIRVSIERCGITQAEFDKLPRAWRFFIEHNSRDSQSLIDQGRRDYDEGHGPNIVKRNNLRGWFR